MVINMKETGIVRHLDELGRIVIPKDIRETLKISEGDKMEFYVDEEKIVLKKHTLFDILEEEIYYLSKTIFEQFKNTIIFTSNYKVVGGYGYLLNKYLDKPLSDEIANLIVQGMKKEIKVGIITTTDVQERILLFPLVNNNYVYGSIIMILDKHNANEDTYFLLDFVASYFAKRFNIW